LRRVAEVQQSYSALVDAPVGLCYTVIGDFEAYPSWSSPVTRTVVLDRYPEEAHGQARRVEFLLDMKLKTIRYVLEYRWDPPRGLAWRLVEGDLAAIEGSYAFEADGASRTRATCSQAVSIGFWVPSLIRRPLEQNAVKQSVLEFKAEAERRAKLG
jgi:Polyketide cyclase / dehydrase and lipid transport